MVFFKAFVRYPFKLQQKADFLAKLTTLHTAAEANGMCYFH